MSTLEMTDSELYEAGITALTDKLGDAEAIRFIRQCQPGTGDYSVDRHKLLANQLDIDTLVQRIQQRRTTREAEEQARVRRFVASQSEIGEMTNLEIYEIGCEILIQKLGVAGSMGFLLQCQQRNGGSPDYLPQSREDATEDIKFYTAILTLNPKVVEDYIKRGNAYSYIGEYTKAIADYGAAIALKPEYPKAYYQRGITYAKNTEYVKAIADYNEVIRRDPKHVEAYRRRGEAWHHLKEQEKANADWMAAKKLEMDSTVPVRA
jgi:tetratricopeptide (TPR) repeat protein